MFAYPIQRELLFVVLALCHKLLSFLCAVCTSLPFDKCTRNQLQDHVKRCPSFIDVLPRILFPTACDLDHVHSSYLPLLIGGCTCLDVSGRPGHTTVISTAYTPTFLACRLDRSLPLQTHSSSILDLHSFISFSSKCFERTDQHQSDKPTAILFY